MKRLVLLVFAACGAITTFSCSEESSTPPTDAASPDTIVLDTGTDAPIDAGACGPRIDAKIAELNDPSSTKKATPGAAVRVKGVIATSPRVLLQKDTTLGTCTYGIFVADANATFLPYSGILLTDTVPGTIDVDASAKLFCTMKEATVFPTDLAIGDLLDVAGTYGSSLSTACVGDAGPTAPASPRLTTLCGLTRVGKATPIAPADVASADLLIGSTNLAKWENGVVRVKNVNAKTALDSFGQFTLVGSNLLVTDRFYSATWGAPKVGPGQPFDEIVGESSLLGCTWALEPRTICDLKPVPRDAGATPPCP